MKPGNSGIAYMNETDYQAESDMRTLYDAQKIKDDPKRMKAAMACAQRQIDALTEAQADANGDDKDTAA